MLKYPGMGRSFAVSVTFGLSLLTAVGCRHTQQHECRTQPMASASNYCPTAPYSTPQSMPHPQGDDGEYVPMPPEPDEATPAPSEAYSVPQRRSPVQAIKDGSRRLGSKLSRMIKGDEEVTEDEMIGRDHVSSPDLQSPGAYSAQPQLGQPAGNQPGAFSGAGNTYPPRVPPVPDSESFDEFDENIDLSLPSENIPGDVELPDGNANYRGPQENLSLPVSNSQGDFDLYAPQLRHSTPTPTLAPAPSDVPQLRDDFNESGNEFNDAQFDDDDFDDRGPQLLPAPGQGGAKQVKFVPVQPSKLNLFQIGTLGLCSEVRSYEDFSEIDRNELRAGQDLLIYNTLTNTESVRSAAGFRTLTRSRVEWLGAGDRVLHQVQLSEAPDASRSVRQDYFLTHQVAVPESLPAGLYTLRLTVEDLFGHQAAHATMQVRVID
ncbi:hypothetical protein [Symmachiella dynata]|uniref:hypothetical protein n=1 Tax=Symmachiella dynata TaxID=2527995 RepID=UPI0030ED4124